MASTMLDLLARCLVIITVCIRLVEANGCNANCSIFASPIPGKGKDQAWQASWTSNSFSSTATAITVVEIVNTDLDTTRTSTIFNTEMKLPTNTNSDGTITQMVTYTRGSKVLTTEIAYPTLFNVIPQTWTWSGQFLTTNSRGQGSCISATASEITASFFSQPATITYSRYDEEDPRGWNVKPDHKFGILGYTDLQSAYPDELALKSCGWGIWAPVANQLAVAYMATTSRLTEGGTETVRPAAVTSTRPANNMKASPTGVSNVKTVVSDGSSGPVTMTMTQTQMIPVATTKSNSGCLVISSSSHIVGSILMAVYAAHLV